MGTDESSVSAQGGVIVLRSYSISSDVKRGLSLVLGDPAVQVGTRQLRADRCGRKGVEFNDVVECLEGKFE